jgi:hypothetical protein
MSKGHRWLWLACLTVGLALSVSNAMGSWYLVDDFSGSSLDTNRWIVTTTTTSEGAGSVSIENGRMMCLSPTRYTTAMAALKVGDDKFFSLNDVGGTLQIAYDFQVAADTARTYNNGVYLRDNSNVTKYTTVGYGSDSTTTRILVGSPADNYQSWASIWTARQLHVELTTDASTARIKVFNVDPDATGPASYTAISADATSTTPGALLVDQVIGTSSITSLDQLLYFQVDGSSNGDVGLSRVYFDNLYASAPVPEPMSLTLLAAGGFLLRRRR